MIWYLENVGRFRHEQDALRALEIEVDWLQVNGWRIDSTSHLCVDAEIKAAGRLFGVTMRYGLNFPFTPPSVQPQVPARWSNHQYENGELCLEYGPDNWRQEITGADMLRSAERLLRMEAGDTANPANLVPSRHSTTPGQDLRHTWARLLATPSLLEILNATPRGRTARAKYWALSREDSYVVLPVELVGAGEDPWVDPSVPPVLKRFADLWNGLAVALPSGLDVPDVTTGRELKAYLARFGFAPPEGYGSEAIEFILVHRADAPELFSVGKDDKVYRLPTILPSGGQRLDADHTILATKTVGIVGCGSVGAKIATMLARSGVLSFVLIDDDILTPENLVRHELDWTSIGEHKVEAVARRIALVVPNATCKLRHQRLGGQEANGVTDWSLTLLRDCDLIVDATASPRVFNLLSSIAQSAARTLVWAEVFGGGIGGLIGRSRPGLDPDPQTVRARVDAWCVEKSVLAPRAATNYEGLQDGVPLVADDADVTVIAAHAARLCIDALVGRSPSWFPVSAYLLGLAPAWLFGQPFHTFPIDVGGPIAPATADLSPDPAHLGAIGQLISKARDEPLPSR